MPGGAYAYGMSRRIASVCFSPSKENIGGAQIPAVAFYQWCALLGYNCDLIGVGGSKEVFFPFEFTRLEDLASKLNNYTHVFFSTPDLPIEITEKLTVPFSIQVHRDSDFELYGSENVEALIEHPLRKLFIHIDANDSWDIDRKCFWHPNALPQNLPGALATKYPTCRDGLLYLARITPWKGSVEFAEFAKKYHGPSFMAGPENIPGRVSDVKAANPDLGIQVGPIDPRDVQKYMQKFLFFWDAFKPEKIIRMDLTGWEAISCGSIPIVNPESVPDFVMDFALDVTDPNLLDLIGKIESDYIQESIARQTSAAHSPGGFHSIKNLVSKMIKGMLQ